MGCMFCCFPHGTEEERLPLVFNVGERDDNFPMKERFEKQPIPKFDDPELQAQLKEMLDLLRSIFDIYDRNNDGLIEFDEYQRCCMHQSDYFRRPWDSNKNKQEFDEQRTSGEMTNQGKRAGINYDQFSAKRLSQLNRAHRIDKERQKAGVRSSRDSARNQISICQSDGNFKWNESRAVLRSLLTGLYMYYYLMESKVSPRLYGSMNSTKSSKEREQEIRKHENKKRLIKPYDQLEPRRRASNPVFNTSSTSLPGPSSSPSSSSSYSSSSSGVSPLPPRPASSTASSYLRSSLDD